ncbi:hypothetical protein MASR2M15_14330 [Anaerolineales bacterium]
MTENETAKRRGKWRWFIAVPLLFICVILTAFAFVPAPEDPVIPLNEQGGGARQGAESLTGLQLAWPEAPTSDPEKAELGWLLFHDPVLSADNDLSCASCHNPNLAYSDGLQIASGAHGQALRRSTPTLWNVAFAAPLFWDGRADSLATQLLEPLTAENEMAADIDGMLEELAAIPEYAERFESLYPDGINVDNVADALVNFQQTLLSQNSAFDRFAAGDFNALTPSQRRGFDIFRSAQTRCFECHAWPTFTHNTFHVLGVQDLDPNQPDLGRIEVLNAADAERGFRTPTLRNVALSAPYMHNGSLATLEDVIDFYGHAGGVEFGMSLEDVDEKLRPFELNDQQVSDLVAFLNALTDEPQELIAIPDALPSGLEPIAKVDNPARDLVEASIAEPYSPESHEPQTFTVKEGESIQAAVDQALPGDTIMVEPGTYYESVYIDTHNIQVLGVVNGDQRPWLDGENTRSDGFNTTGDNFLLQGFGLRGYVGNGVLTTGSQGVVYRDLIIEGTYAGDVQTIYGLYPVEATNVLIEDCNVTGIADAGIYVGQSRGPIIVRNNVVHGNVTGIEIENSTNAEVYNNHVYNNVGGILVFLLPNNPSRIGYNTRVYDNLIEDNNHAQFAKEGSTVSVVPSGTGILILTADNTEVFHNTIRNNKSIGLGLTSLYMIYNKDTVFDLGPLPENNWIHDNIWENNGYDPTGLVVEQGLPGSDILWSGEGWNNAFDEPTASAFPPILPGKDWSDPARRALWRFYDIVIGLLL